MTSPMDTISGSRPSFRRQVFAIFVLFAFGADVPLGHSNPTLSDQAARTPSRFRAFNDTEFTLAYDVFLEAQDIPSAFELAKEAVRQKPELHAWRERFARTAEWIGNPAVAQAEWQKLGDQSGQARAYKEAIRLAGLLRNPTAAVRAWESLSRIQSLDSSEWASLIEAYESSGQVDRCVRMLKNKLNTRFDKGLAMTLVEIHVRTDNDQEAMDLLSRMNREFGRSLEFSLGQARILLRHGKLREAVLVLDSIPEIPSPDSSHATILRMKASVYSSLQRNGDALEAYRLLFATGRYTAEDLLEMNAMARTMDPEFALRTAIAGWSQFHDVSHLIYYLERCIELSRWDLASRQLARLKPEHRSILETAPYFLILASRIHQYEGKYGLARREYRQALRLEPDMEDFQAGYIWLVLEQGDSRELALLADSLGQGPSTPKALLEPLAAACLALHRQADALAYFRLLRESKEKHDFPFLLRYAEILKDVGDGGGSERAYRRAQSARRIPEQDNEAENRKDWLESELKWLQAFGMTDRNEKMLTGILRQYPEDRALKELAFQMKVRRGENPDDAMRAVQQESGMASPFSPWANLAVAMHKMDLDGVSRILNSPDSRLNPDDRERALKMIGHSRQPDFKHSSGEVNGGVHFDFHPHYEERRTEFQIQAPWQEALLFSLEGNFRNRPWVSSGVLSPVAEREVSGRIGLTYSTNKSQTRANVGLRHSQIPKDNGKESQAITYDLHSDWQPLRELVLSAGFGLHLRAEENPVLAVTSLKDQAQFLAKWELPWNATYSMSAARSWYRAWNNRFLGQGAQIQTALEQNLVRPLDVGGAFAFHHFSKGETDTSTTGQKQIGGTLPEQEFPRSYAHAKIYAEWTGSGRTRSSWLPTPLAHLEAGRNWFPDFPANLQTATHEVALRCGFVLQPGPFQSLTFLAEYARGVNGRRETESALSIRYGHTLN